ncbi:MAG: hypothetical protein WAN50_00180 [Minisyncoccia bacterium]
MQNENTAQVCAHGERVRVVFYNGLLWNVATWNSANAASIGTALVDWTVYGKLPADAERIECRQ